jgi:Tfp pilus assembly protein PilF
MVYLQAGDKAQAKERLEKAVRTEGDYIGREDAQRALSQFSGDSST